MNFLSAVAGWGEPASCLHLQADSSVSYWSHKVGSKQTHCLCQQFCGVEAISPQLAQRSLWEGSEMNASGGAGVLVGFSKAKGSLENGPVPYSQYQRVDIPGFPGI